MDVLESSLISEPKNSTERVLSTIYELSVQHRDQLGFPKGSTSFPYFIVSNDVSLKFMQFIRLTIEKGVTLDETIVFDLFENLIAAYDDDQGCACCRHHFSLPKDLIIDFFDQIKAYSSSEV